MQQQHNMKTNRFLEYNGEIKCQNEWAQQLGTDSSTIRYRLRRGWTIEQTLTTPVKFGNRIVPHSV